MKAFDNYQYLEPMDSLEDKHRGWLLDYEGLNYSFATKGKHKRKWATEPKQYKNEDFRSDLNMVARKPDRLIIEFDDDAAAKIPGHIEKVKTKLQDLKIGYIESTHKGKSNYLWVEFTRDLTTEEAKLFLDYISPKDSVVDLNFTSDNKLFPVLFGRHWKHSSEFEMPVAHFEGSKIDYDKLGIKKKKVKTTTKIKDGFEYEVRAAPKFNYEFQEMEITSLDELKKIIEKNFPAIWFETKACLSACATLCLKNLNGCPSLNLIGSPSGEKTTVLSFFYGQDKTYLTDDFTPRAFVSHSANVKGEDLNKVDLLPKIRNKILLSPELAPLFEASKEKLLDNFSILTRVLDGEGLNRDSGVHGHRGYSGDYKFVWLGASTPLKFNVWKIMGKIGNRLFFLNMREKNRSEGDYVSMFSGKAYEEKIKECRGAVRSFLDNLYKQYGEREIQWDAEGDIFILQKIVKYAQFLSKLRGSLMIWKGEEKGTHEYSFPILEEPPRAINSLYNLAKGNALIHGRKFLRTEDLEIVRAVTFSSMPHDRYEFLKVLAKHEGKLTTKQIETELNCSDETARRTMKIFDILGLVELKTIQVEVSGYGRPMNYIEVKKEFKELLSLTQGRFDLDNSKPHQTRGVCVENPYEDSKKIINSFLKNDHTHPQNDVEKAKPHQTRGVREEK